MRNKGSSLVDYVLPTAIIGVMFGLAIFTMHSGGSLMKFISASMNMNVDMTKGKGVIGKQTSLLDSLGGTQDNPVKQCSSGECTIDAGIFVLTNIPDSDTFIETAGSSGATDGIAELISQLASQIVDDPNTPENEKNDLQTLANLGHFIADYEHKIEDVIKDCSTQSDSKTCMQSNFWMGKTPITLELPDNLKDVLPDYTSSKSSFLMQSQSFLEMGFAAKRCLNGGTCKTTSGANDAFYSYYDTVMNSSSTSYTPEIKSVVTELFQDISLLGYNMNLQIQNAAGGSASGGGYDPLTGEFVNVKYPNVSDLNEILHPKTSIGSNLDSAIMCAVGGKPDEGYSCK